MKLSKSKFVSCHRLRSFCLYVILRRNAARKRDDTGTTNGLRHGTQFGEKELVTVCAWRCVAMLVRWSSACHVVAKISKCWTMYFTTRHYESVKCIMRDIVWHDAFREQFVTYAWQTARHGANQTWTWVNFLKPNPTHNMLYANPTQPISIYP